MPERPDPEWTAELDGVLTLLSRTLRSPQLHGRVARAAGVELGEHLHLTLAHIAAREPVRVLDLAESLDLERSAMSRRVTQLADAGLVERTVDPADRRAAALRLTPAGRRTLTAVQREWTRLLGELTAAWSVSRRETTLRQLSQLAAELQQLLADPAGAPRSRR